METHLLLDSNMDPESLMGGSDSDALGEEALEVNGLWLLAAFFRVFSYFFYLQLRKVMLTTKLTYRKAIYAGLIWKHSVPVPDEKLVLGQAETERGALSDPQPPPQPIVGPSPAGPAPSRPPSAPQTPFAG